MPYFVESSALLKRYAPETGSAWISVLTDPNSGEDIFVAEITLVEIAAGLAAKTRASGSFDATARDRAVALLLHDAHTRFSLIPINRPIVNLGIDLTKRYPLRGYDAVQLATGLVTSTQIAVLGPIAFVSADQDLLNAAQAEGLLIDNPNLHP